MEKQTNLLNEVRDYDGTERLRSTQLPCNWR